MPFTNKDLPHGNNVRNMPIPGKPRRTSPVVAHATCQITFPRLKHCFVGALIPFSAVLTGCAGSVYERPSLDVPARWVQANVVDGHTTPDAVPWWTRFGDARLERLIAEVLSRNNDLATAALNVWKAEIRAGLAGDPLQLGAEAGVNVRRDFHLDSGEATRNNIGMSRGTVSYTIDLWGRLAQQRSIAEWALLASEADRETARLNVIATAANLYWRLAYLNQRLASEEQSLATALHTQQLVNAQNLAGIVSALERREAEQTVLTQKSSLSQLRQSQVETRNALAIMFNAAPGSNVLEEVLGQEPPALPAGTLPLVEGGLPADLLGRRPDMRAAELRLRQSLANVDVVRTSYYPNLSLTSAVGSSSTSLGSLLANPVAILGAGLNLPFLNLKAMRVDTRIAQVEYESAVIGFRQALYQAFADVENALSARVRLAEQADLRALNLTAAREAERLYETRYRAGAVALRTWLDAQESHRTAELLWAQTRLSQLQNFVALYQAVGGDMSMR
ncbi:efflux transporter outer membrane subunit [Burkholderia sp. BCC0044]|uniref:efflux transporter outer membrane subunit n=1 Tax=Burkholderia sp. BCC0044 TaxID=2676295 RepID=UPI001FC7D7FE|nr:efflux transporter outer membrane subunit [Burkholderia sp. BCC0044]